MLRKASSGLPLGKVAIIILNYNSSDETLSCLKSLENLDYPILS